MGTLPKVAAEGRMARLCAIACLGIGQAVALGVVAFATRAAFGAMADGQVPRSLTFFLLVGGGIGVGILQVAVRVQAEAVGQSFASSLRHKLYAHIAGMNQSDLAARRQGSLSMRFVGDLSAARAWAGGGIAQAIPALVVLPAAFLTLVLLQPALAVAALLPLFVALILAGLSASGLGEQHRQLRRRRSGIALSMMERVKMAPELDLTGRTTSELSRLDKAGRSLAREATTRRMHGEWLRVLPQLGAALGGAAVIWTASRGGLPTAETAAALAILPILVSPLIDLAAVWDRWCAWRIARDAYMRLLVQPSQLRRVVPRGGPVPVIFKGRTHLGRTVDVNISAGALATIWGPPGSGKSDLARLIAAQNQPGAGYVAYGLNDNKLPRIAYVGSAPLAPKGSLRRTLTLGIAPRPGGRDIRRVAQAYGLRRVLDRIGSTRGHLPEGGGGLSTHEQLALGLSRAALMRPDLIVIDHPALCPDHVPLIRKLHKETGATLVVVTKPELFPDAVRVMSNARDQAALRQEKLPLEKVGLRQTKV